MVISSRPLFYPNGKQHKERKLQFPKKTLSSLNKVGAADLTEAQQKADHKMKHFAAAEDQPRCLPA